MIINNIINIKLEDLNKKLGYPLRSTPPPHTPPKTKHLTGRATCGRVLSHPAGGSLDSGHEAAGTDVKGAESSWLHSTVQHGHPSITHRHW